MRNNRKKLVSIIQTIILCGQQNIPFRGHRDSLVNIENDPTGRHGNFWALLQFRINAGDEVLKNHLATAAGNVMYTSPDIQNQLISVLGDYVRNKIICRVKEAKFFTVVADEVTDCSNKEQLGTVLRYVNSSDNLIREDLVTFVECDTGVTGRAIANKLLTFITSSGVDPKMLRGQSYDGAGNMSGKTNGAAAIISSSNPLALYLHCTSHCLNLAVVASLTMFAT